MYRKDVLFCRIKEEQKQKLSIMADELHKTKGQILEELIDSKYKTFCEELKRIKEIQNDIARLKAEIAAAKGV